MSDSNTRGNRLGMAAVAMLWAMVVLALTGCGQSPVGPSATPAPVPVPVDGWVRVMESQLGIPGATVLLTDTAGRSTTATTNQDGGYSLGLVAPGPATVQVTAPGFQSITTSGAVRVPTTWAFVLRPLR